MSFSFRICHPWQHCIPRGLQLPQMNTKENEICKTTETKWKIWNTMLWDFPLLHFFGRNQKLDGTINGVGTKTQSYWSPNSTNIPEKRRLFLHRSGRLKSWTATVQYHFHSVNVTDSHRLKAQKRGLLYINYFYSTATFCVAALNYSAFLNSHSVRKVTWE